MSTTLQIRVTREILKKAAYCGHIKEKGKWLHSDDESVCVASNCAIALAVRDIFPNALVEPFHIHPFGNEMFGACYSEIDLPKKATDFIMAFDDLMPEDRRIMEPLEFEVEVPDDVLKHAFSIEDLVKELLSNHPTLKVV